MKTRAAALMLALMSAAPARAGHRLALLVGADHGDAGEAELRYAAAEAARLGAVLRDVGDFAADDVVVLSAPTPETLTQALAQLRARAEAAGDGALLFVFYSGHADGESLHLGGGHASLTALRDAVAETPAAARVLVVDACRSGTLTRVKGGHAGPAFDVRLDPPLGARGFAILTSSAAGEDAQESDDVGSSLFTHFFTSALLGAGDKNGDGEITLEEAFAYASERTIVAAGSSLMGPQHPTFRYDLGGRAGLVLTHPGRLNARTGRFQFPEPGWYLVRRPDGPIMAELHATRARSIAGAARGALSSEPPAARSLSRGRHHHRAGRDRDARAQAAAPLFVPTRRAQGSLRPRRAGGCAAPASQVVAVDHRRCRRRGRRGRARRRPAAAGRIGLQGSNLLMRALGIFVIVIGIGGCGIERINPCTGMSGTCLALHVDGAGGVTHIDGVRVRVRGGGVDREQTSTPDSGRVMPLPVALALRFPAVGAKPMTVTVDVTGRLGGSDIAGGSAQVLIRPGMHASVDVMLAGAAFPATTDMARAADLAQLGPDASCARGSSVRITAFKAAQTTLHLSTAATPRTTPVTVTLAGLSPCDGGGVTLSAQNGSLGPATCERSGDGATCTATYTAPTGGDSDGIAARSDDSGAIAGLTIALRPAVTITLPPRIDLLAFGKPAPAVTISAAVGNLLPGDPDSVSFSLAGTSATLVSGASGGTSAVVAAADLPFPAQAAPTPTTLTARADADPAAGADVTLVVHAFVDETPRFLSQLGSAFDGQFGVDEPEIWGVAENASGTVLVGGKFQATDSDSNFHEAAYVAAFDGTTWSSAGFGFVQSAVNPGGAITSAVATPGGDFLVAGVAGDTGAGGYQLLALHCSGAPLQCGDSTHNLAPAGQFANAPPLFNDIGNDDFANSGKHHGPYTVTVRPRITAGLSGGKLHKYLAWSAYMPGTCDDSNASQAAAHLVADASGDLDTAFVLDDAHTIPLGQELPASTSGDSCPLNPLAPANAVTGWAVAGDRLWLAGYADCGAFQVGPVGSCDLSFCGCDTKLNPMSGLAVEPIADAATPASWTTLSPAIAGADVRCPVIARGSDDTLLFANGCMNGSGAAALGWVGAGQTAPALIVPPVPGVGLGEYVAAVAGSSSGGSPWAGTGPDVFFALTRRTASLTNPTSKTFFLGWYGGAGSGRLLMQTGAQDIIGDSDDAIGFELIDLSAVQLGDGSYDVWAVGRGYDPAGFANSPVILRLR